MYLLHPNCNSPNKAVNPTVYQHLSSRSISYFSNSFHTRHTDHTRTPNHEFILPHGEHNQNSLICNFKPSGHSTSKSVLQGTSTADEVTTFTPAPSRDSHTTQSTTTITGLWTAPTHHDTALGTSVGTSLSITSTTNSLFSQSAPDPAVTWSSATRFTSHPTPLSVTSTSPTVTGSTMKAETSGRGTLGSWSLTVAQLAQFSSEECLREDVS